MKKVENKKGKIRITAVLGIILAAVVLCNIAYFAYLSIKQSKAEDELSAVIDTAVEECTSALDEFGMTETQQSYIDTYKQNMEDTETVLQRAYIAEAMLTYAVNSTNTINSNNLTEAYNGGLATQSKAYLVDELTASEQRLRAAIESYTVYDEN